MSLNRRGEISHVEPLTIPYSSFALQSLAVYVHQMFGHGAIPTTLPFDTSMISIVRYLISLSQITMTTPPTVNQ